MVRSLLLRSQFKQILQLRGKYLDKLTVERPLNSKLNFDLNSFETFPRICNICCKLLC